MALPLRHGEREEGDEGERHGQGDQVVDGRFIVVLSVLAFLVRVDERLC